MVINVYTLSSIKTVKRPTFFVLLCQSRFNCVRNNGSSRLGFCLLGSCTRSGVALSVYIFVSLVDPSVDNEYVIHILMI